MMCILAGVFLTAEVNITVQAREVQLYIGRMHFKEVFEVGELDNELGFAYTFHSLR